jgi:hypothetical protein
MSLRSDQFGIPLTTFLAVCFLAAWMAYPCAAQDLEPRRWDHLPIDTNFAGAAYVFTDAQINFDPVLRIDDAVMQRHTYALKYIRTFELLRRSARLELLQAYQDAQWSGLLDGVPASVRRSGQADTEMRFAINLIGAPPLNREEFAAYKAALESETIVGLGLVMQFPTGAYLEDKLLNIGSNRYTFRPQLGILHSRDRWAFDATLASWIYTDNNEFVVDNKLEQDPLYTAQLHAVYTIAPGQWLGAGFGYGIGKETAVNGIPSNNEEEILGWELAAGYPITSTWSVKLKYVGLRRQRFVGSSSNNFFVSTTIVW